MGVRRRPRNPRIENRHDLDRMPGARFFPDATINFAENLLSRRGAEPAIIFNGEERASTDGQSRRSCRRRSCVLPRRSEREGIVPAIASPDTCQTCPRRSSRRSAPPRSAPSGRRARRTSACRACSIASVRSSRGCSSPPTATSTAARRHDLSPRVPRSSFVHCRRSSARWSCPTWPATRSPLRMARSQWDEFLSRRRSTLASSTAFPFNHPLYILYSSGHDRRAEVHRARRRRHADPAPEGASAPLRHSRRRSRVLLHDLRLDDVELARDGARLGRDAAAVRRLAVPSRRQRAVRPGGRDRRDALRHVGEVHRRRRQGRAVARATRIGSQIGADDDVDGIAAGAGELRLRLRARQERRPPRVDLRRHRHRRLLRRRQSRRARSGAAKSRRARSG